ncbi:MAG: 2-C-methyl-D-erythritol 2,4-cyclodiphosphate synthase [Candidatus Schekmanbacteria bacterium]|nr:MAG: 2-C-methyl-D-erythritol 2,4-cyclodiphosphate synthase [Candidatus Schekmanbacteria bacterium]
MRIGIGNDVHPFEEGRRLVIAGIEIPYERGLGGHSDADVLSHAICDALIGALGEGDIGEHFPDTDDEYENISSLVLLKKVKELIDNNGFFIENIDATIIAEEPNFSDYKDRMEQNLSEVLEIEPHQINIKAKTNEKMGFIGRKEGVAAIAVALINTF